MDFEIRDAVLPDTDYLKVEDRAFEEDHCFIVAYEHPSYEGEECAIALDRAGMIALRDELDRRLGDA